MAFFLLFYFIYFFIYFAYLFIYLFIYLILKFFACVFSVDPQNQNQNYNFVHVMTAPPSYLARLASTISKWLCSQQHAKLHFSFVNDCKFRGHK